MYYVVAQEGCFTARVKYQFLEGAFLELRLDQFLIVDSIQDNLDSFLWHGEDP